MQKENLFFFSFPRRSTLSKGTIKRAEYKIILKQLPTIKLIFLHFLHLRHQMLRNVLSIRAFLYFDFKKNLHLRYTYTTPDIYASRSSRTLATKSSDYYHGAFGLLPRSFRTVCTEPSDYYHGISGQNVRTDERKSGQEVWCKSGVS